MESVEVHQGSGQFSRSLYAQEQLFLCRTLANMRDGPAPASESSPATAPDMHPLYCALTCACRPRPSGCAWQPLSGAPTGAGPDRAAAGRRRSIRAAPFPGFSGARRSGRGVHSASGWPTDGDRSAYRSRSAYRVVAEREHRASGSGSARRRLCSRGAPLLFVRSVAALRFGRSGRGDGAGPAAVQC